MAVGVARRVYAAIGVELARRDHDIEAPRAVVPPVRKAQLAMGAAVAAALSRVRVPRRVFTVPARGQKYDARDLTLL